MLEVHLRNVRRLIDALRSGKYFQGTGKLRVNEHAFCCLGVACDVSGSGTWEIESGNYYYVLPSGESAWATLPTDLRKAFFPDSYDGNPYVPVGEIVAPLTDHNDEYRHSFVEIADGLESHYRLAVDRFGTF